MKAKARWPKLTSRLMTAILLLAFFLRVYRLDGQSFWSDEGISLLRSALPLGEMLRSMPVEHVPGYFVILHFWLRIAGTTDFALRYLSVLPSVLAVAVIARLAVEMVNSPPNLGGTLGSSHAKQSFASSQDWGAGGAASRIALTTALLLTTSAFQVWYAQETRMYTWLLLMGLTASWCLWRLINRPADGWLLPAIGYIATIVGGIYLHYYGFLVPLAHTVFMIGWVLATRDWRTFVRWALCGLAVALLFLPWLPRALSISSFDGWRDPGEPWSIPWQYLTAYTVGDAMPEPLRAWLPALYAGLAFLGVAIWWRVRRAASLFLLVNLLVPLSAVLVYALNNPDFHERYAIALSGPLFLLIGGGVLAFDLRSWGVVAKKTAWTRFLPLLLLACLVVLNGLALCRHYADTSTHKPDFKGAAWRIQHEEAPGEVILVDGPDPEKVFGHYYTGPNPVFDLRHLDEADWETVDAALTEATADADVAWELLYFHAPGPVQMWLATRGWATGQSDHTDIRVVKYGLPGAPMISREINTPFGDELTLVSADVGADPLQGGDLLRVSTHWFTHAPPPEYKFSMRLLDESGNAVFARDYIPQNGFAPTYAWVVGQPATDQRGILLPPELAPGTYTMTLRLYDPVTGAAVDTPVGQDVILGEIEIGHG